MHRVFTVLNRMHHFLNIPNPLKNMEISIQPDRTLRNEDFISPDEEKRLKYIVTSLEGLSEKQLPVRLLLMDRNIAILNLLIDYGLSLQELTALTMHHVHFETNTLSIPATAGVERTITLAKEDKNNYIIITKVSQNQFALSIIVMIHCLSHLILTAEHTGGYMKMMHQRH